MDKIVGGNQIEKGRFKLNITQPYYFKKDAMKFNKKGVNIQTLTPFFDKSQALELL